MQPLGIAGALFMMFAHGIISPLLFAVAGAFKHHYHTLEIGSMRGIAHHSPWLAAHMMLGWMASLGLPLLAGFVARGNNTDRLLDVIWMARTASNSDTNYHCSLLSYINAERPFSNLMTSSWNSTRYSSWGRSKGYLMA